MSFVNVKLECSFESVCRVWVIHVTVHYLAPIETEIDPWFLN